MDLTLTVLRRQTEADSIVVFELGAPDRGDLPPFEAGAHIDVQTPGGPVRQYSLCGSPAERGRYTIAVLLEQAGRGGSAAMHQRLYEGDQLMVSAPKNHFPLREDAPNSLLLAAGVGITPLIAMAERLHSLGSEFSLHYTTRSAQQTVFLSRLHEAPFASRMQLHHSGTAQRRMDIPAALGLYRAGTHLYACGPGEFIHAVRACAADAGWPDACVHFEYFAGNESHSPEDRHFDVVLQRSQRVVRVQPDETVTDALRREGVDLPTSCEQGVCGTCLTRVLEGVILHKDLYLTPAEQAANDQFLPCCSRALSERLVLDL